MGHRRRLENVVLFLPSFVGERWIAFSHLDQMSLPPTWILIAAETYSVIEYLDFVGTEMCLNTLNDRFKICADTVRVVEIVVGRRMVQLQDGESVFLDGELVLAPSYTINLDIIPPFNVVVGCRGPVFRDIFELVGFLMLV